MAIYSARRPIRIASLFSPDLLLALGMTMFCTWSEAPQAQNTPESKPQLVTFQQDIQGYSATVDTEIWRIAPTKVLDKQGTMTTDNNNGGGESQVLMKFGKLIGDQPDQIPPFSTILHATLTVVAFDPGNTVHLHRMLIPWNHSATWNLLGDGVTVDDHEATRVRDGLTFGHIVMDKQSVQFNVTDSVQAWVNGEPNYGWVFINTGNNGWDFYSSDWIEVDLHPSVEIKYLPPKKSIEQTKAQQLETEKATS